MDRPGQTRTGNVRASLLVFVFLTAAYILTAPQYHTTAIDSYNFAFIISEREFFRVPERLFLWLSSMQGLYALASLVVTDPDPFVLVGYANAIQTALAVVMLQHLLSRHYGLQSPASWLTVLIFAASYGTWRYATELEVYASVFLVSTALLLVAFSVVYLPSHLWSRRVAFTAVAGTFASLMYQPLGIVAGFAVPVFLMCKLPFRETIRYYVIYGLTLIGGFGFMNWVKSKDTSWVVLDADGKLPSLPDITALAASCVAFLQNLLSMNWAFAFPPSRHLIEQNYSQEYAQELFATDPAFWGYKVFFVTIPASLGLLAIALINARTKAPLGSLSAQELSAIAFFVVYALMVLSLHPEGFEAWLPTLVPVFLLLGSRLARPLQQSGQTVVLLLLLAVFLVHNWFAGVGMLATAQRDYNRALAEPIHSRLDTEDLVVVGTDWPFERYANYVGKSAIVLLSRSTTEDVILRVNETLSDGHKVLIYSDAIKPTASDLKREKDLAFFATQLPQAVLENAEKIELDTLGFALLLMQNRP